MNSDAKYIFNGIIYLIAIIFVISIADFFISHHHSNFLQESKESFSAQDLTQDSAFVAGKILFEGHCEACHHIHGTDDFLLNDLTKIIKDKKLIFGIIKNSDSVLKSGNTYYNQQFKNYNEVHMTAFPALTQNDLDNLLVYLKSEILLHKLPTP